jgi:hypothetical protein
MKDGIQAFADEVTLLRQELLDLKRSSLTKDEAKALNRHVAQGVADMTKVGATVQQTLLHSLATAALDVRRDAAHAATEAAKDAIREAHYESVSAARDLRKAAGEARREAWRWFGGFWVWLASVGATGALLGALAVMSLQGRADARRFGDYPKLYCTSAGGEIVKQDNGSSFCAIWIERLDRSR